MRAVFLAPVIVVMLAEGATAAPRCMTRVAKATGAIEDPSSVMAAGETFGPITQIRIAKSNGRVVYCAHGSYCYPSTNLDFITACKFDSFPSYQDDEDRYYDPK